MAIVKSVEKVQVSITAATEPVTVNLSKGQNEAQCVPWHTSRWATNPVTDFNDELYYEVEIIDNGGTPAVRVTATARAATQTQVIEVFVVEFAAAINVQQLPVTIADATASVNVTVADVTAQSSAFLLYSAQNEGTADDDFDNACMRVNWNGASTTSVTIDRDDSVASMNGTLYVVDCDSGEFIVEYAVISRGSDSNLSATVTISATVLADTFIIHTYKDDQAADDIFDSVWHADMQDTTTVRIRRAISGTPTPTLSAHVIQVVECQNSEWGVQHGELTLGLTTDTDTITEVDLARSMVIGTHLEGGLSLPRDNATTGDVKARQACALDFSSSTAIRVQRESALSTDSEWRYQVVEFELVTAGNPYYSYAQQ